MTTIANSGKFRLVQFKAAGIFQIYKKERDLYRGTYYKPITSGTRDINIAVEELSRMGNGTIMPTKQGVKLGLHK